MNRKQQHAREAFDAGWNRQSLLFLAPALWHLHVRCLAKCDGGPLNKHLAKVALHEHNECLKVLGNRRPQ